MPDSGNSPTRKKSLKVYASDVFKESSLSAVASAVSPISTPRKIFRVLVFLVFSACFIYQCVKFLNYILQYPTNVNIEILKPDEYMTPGYTFCNYNNIKRSSYCKRFPQRCIYPNEQLCAEYPHSDIYCGNNTLIPKEEYFVNPQLSDDEMLDFGFDLEDLLIAYPNGGEDELPMGPLPRYREQEGGGVSGCYSLYSRVDDSRDPHNTIRPRLWESHTHDFVFDAEEFELFNPYSKPGVIFSIHNPFDAVNPFRKGIFLKPGYTYAVTIKMQLENLLPAPYKTNCSNYTETWLKNNKRGPRSQEMCRNHCAQRMAEKCFNCSPVRILYPSRNVCYSAQTFDGNCSRENFYDEVVTCAKACKDDCEWTKFTYEVTEYSRPAVWNNESMNWKSRRIAVSIEFEDKEIVKLQYTPQYQEVEAFSYIGGFIGIWLGVSLVQVADIFESIFRIFRYCFTKSRRFISKKPEDQQVA